MQYYLQCRANEICHHENLKLLLVQHEVLEVDRVIRDQVQRGVHQVHLPLDAHEAELLLIWSADELLQLAVESQFL